MKTTIAVISVIMAFVFAVSWTLVQIVKGWMNKPFDVSAEWVIGRIGEDPIVINRWFFWTVVFAVTVFAVMLKPSSSRKESK